MYKKNYQTNHFKQKSKQNQKKTQNQNEIAIVVRVNKIRETMPKLNVIPANDALDDDELEELRKRMKRAPLYLSATPSPIPPDEIDPEIDPDNVVIRGAYTDDDDN